MKRYTKKQLLIDLEKLNEQIFPLTLSASSRNGYIGLDLGSEGKIIKNITCGNSKECLLSAYEFVVYNK